jgi:hypothetical protein
MISRGGAGPRFCRLYVVYYTTGHCPGGEIGIVSLSTNRTLEQLTSCAPAPFRSTALASTAYLWPVRSSSVYTRQPITMYIPSLMLLAAAVLSASAKHNTTWRDVDLVYPGLPPSPGDTVHVGALIVQSVPYHLPHNVSIALTWPNGTTRALVDARQAPDDCAQPTNQSFGADAMVVDVGRYFATWNVTFSDSAFPTNKNGSCGPPPYFGSTFHFNRSFSVHDPSSTVGPMATGLSAEITETVAVVKSGAPRGAQVPMLLALAAAFGVGAVTPCFA